MYKKLIFSSLMFVVVLVACATSPTGQRQLRLFSDSQMAEMGTASYAEMKKKTPPAKEAAANKRVQCVSNALTSIVGGQWEVTLFDDDSANAFALPGGKIGVYKGLLKIATTPGQLAAVIGHEISHVQANHSNARMSAASLTDVGMQIASTISGGSPKGQYIMAALGLGTQVGVLLPFGRAQESEADILGINLMAKAGFDPNESVTLWQAMARQGSGQPPEFISTHPSHSTRISDLKAQMPKALKLYDQARAAGRKPNC